MIWNGNAPKNVVATWVGSIAVASFAELSNSMQNLDVWIVFIAFILLSHLVMVNPFLVILYQMENLPFFVSLPWERVCTRCMWRLYSDSVFNDGRMDFCWKLTSHYMRHHRTISLFFGNEIFTLLKGLHFSGSCAQWVMGSWPSVRLWLNKSAPVLLLTASDSVYKYHLPLPTVLS